jgi:hypothetical protein
MYFTIDVSNWHGQKYGVVVKRAVGLGVDLEWNDLFTTAGRSCA